MLPALFGDCMKSIIKVLVVVFISLNFQIAVAEEKDEGILDFKKKCKAFDSKTDSGIIDPTCFSKEIKNTGKDSLMGFTSGKPIGKTYAQYITKEEKKFSLKEFKKKGTGNIKRSVDKFMFISNEPADGAKADDGRHFFCDMDAKGFLNVGNRVQCIIVSNSYCSKLYDLKKSLTKCQEENFEKFKVVDKSREVNKEWYSRQIDGAQNVINLIEGQLDNRPKLDFNKWLWGNKTQIELKHIKGDFETGKTINYYERQERLNNALFKDFDAELVLCEEAFQTYASWLDKPRDVLEPTGAIEAGTKNGGSSSAVKRQ